MMSASFTGWDLLILTAVLFGPALYSSLVAIRQPLPVEEDTAYGDAENWYALLSQSVQLGLAMGYLYLRDFDFGQWQFAISWRATLFALGLFLLLGLAMDFVTNSLYGWRWVPQYVRSTVPIMGALSEVRPSLVAYALFNGVFEELFFLGICTAIDPTYSAVVVVFSVLLRISFHAYQGWGVAIGMGLLVGVTYYFSYTLLDANLYPYMLSHALADVFGLSLIRLL